MSENTVEQYWKDVLAIAKEIFEDCPIDVEYYDLVHESIDGCEWIIYDYRHETVLTATENYPDPSDVHSISKEDASWEELRQTAAFLAMEQDVLDEINSLHYLCYTEREERENR